MPATIFADYESTALASASPYERRLFAIAADELTRLCGVRRQADVTDATLGRFADRLREDGADRETIRLSVDAIRAAVEWSRGTVNA